MTVSRLLWPTHREQPEPSVLTLAKSTCSTRQDSQTNQIHDDVLEGRDVRSASSFSCAVSQTPAPELWQEVAQ